MKFAFFSALLIICDFDNSKVKPGQLFKIVLMTIFCILNIVESSLFCQVNKRKNIFIFFRPIFSLMRKDWRELDRNLFTSDEEAKKRRRKSCFIFGNYKTLM